MIELTTGQCILVAITIVIVIVALTYSEKAREFTKTAMLILIARALFLIAEKL